MSDSTSTISIQIVELDNIVSDQTEMANLQDQVQLLSAADDDAMTVFYFDDNFSIDEEVQIFELDESAGPEEPFSKDTGNNCDLESLLRDEAKKQEARMKLELVMESVEQDKKKAIEKKATNKAKPTKKISSFPHTKEARLNNMKALKAEMAAEKLAPFKQFTTKVERECDRKKKIQKCFKRLKLLVPGLNECSNDTEVLEATVALVSDLKSTMTLTNMNDWGLMII